MKKNILTQKPDRIANEGRPAWVTGGPATLKSEDFKKPDQHNTICAQCPNCGHTLPESRPPVQIDQDRLTESSDGTCPCGEKWKPAPGWRLYREREVDGLVETINELRRDKEFLQGALTLAQEGAEEMYQPSNCMVFNEDSRPGQGFCQIALSCLQKAGLAIEENHPNHIDKGEEGLRDEMMQCIKMLNSNVAAESKKAKGKRDIAIKDRFSDKELAAECLIWKGPIYYQSKKDQLFDRYLTWHDKEATLITFIRNKNFIDILPTAKKAIKKLSDSIEGRFQDLSSGSHILYVSEHNHMSGITVRLFHMFFHLPKGI